MHAQIKYDTRYSPSPEVLRLLELSWQEVEEMDKRDLKCPICGFRIEGVYADRTGHAEVKCRKCKFEGPVNLAYFRRQKRHGYCFIRSRRRKRSLRKSYSEVYEHEDSDRTASSGTDRPHRCL